MRPALDLLLGGLAGRSFPIELMDEAADRLHGRVPFGLEIANALPQIDFVPVVVIHRVRKAELPVALLELVALLLFMP